MIEPQNTMMPLPAESATAEAPNGEAGFGEMLAQTLGMVPQVDPNAISRILGDGAGRGRDAEQDGESERSGTQDLAGVVPADQKQEDHISVANWITTPAVAVVATPVSSARTMPRIPILDPPVLGPIADEDGLEPLPVLTDGEPIGLTPSLPRPAPIAPGDGIWKPVLSDHPEIATSAAGTADEGLGGGAPRPEAPGSAAGTPRAEVEPSPVVPAAPGPAPGPASARPAPVTLPSESAPAPVPPVAAEDPIEVIAPAAPTHDPSPITAAAARSVVPAKTGRGPSEPSGEPGPPVASSPPSPGTGAPPVAHTPAPSPAPRAPEPRVSLLPDAAVPVRETQVQLTGGARSVADNAVTAEPGVTGIPGGVPSVDTVQPQPMTAGSFATPATPTQFSALAERVLHAVELQANQPPPRTMVVDIPEIEGLRLVVSVRGGAEVHVVPSTSSATSGGLQTFMDELHGVLANRGFVMTGDGRRRGSNPHEDERPEPRRAERPVFRRPQPTDSDLRI